MDGRLDSQFTICIGRLDETFIMGSLLGRHIHKWVVPYVVSPVLSKSRILEVFACAGEP